MTDPILLFESKMAQTNWLISRNSLLKLDFKLLIYKSALKSIWCYGVQLWASNAEKNQRRQNKILRMITAASWYIKNSNIHKELDVPLVKMEIIRYAEKYFDNLDGHTNSLVRGNLLYAGRIRLKRKVTFELSRRWERYKRSNGSKIYCLNTLFYMTLAK